MTDRSPLNRVTAMPAGTNPCGGAFGGWLMAQMALGGGSLASRVSQGKAVEDALGVHGQGHAAGTAPLTIAARSIARQRNGATPRTLARDTFKFVLLDEDRRPQALAANPTLLLPKDD